MIIETISQGMLLGLSTGIFCLVTCVPVYVPFVLSEDRKLRRNILAIGEIAMGRLIAYLFFWPDPGNSRQADRRSMAQQSYRDCYDSAVRPDASLRGGKKMASIRVVQAE
ncbi:hypothetical protein [Methanosarcina barkeri]|uniref:hypothetical protein n=1 Tax=Methanosarcina barkeri TaxID=2208 RepID=UPI000A3E4928|nr:hypothetical protein [Methanosarcina barkeri]